MQYQPQFHHTNKTTAAQAVAQAETVFKATQPPSVSANKKQGGPEKFPTREYRENEEWRIEQAIERQRQQRLERDAGIPPTKQRKQRGRLSKQRIPEGLE